MLRQRSSLAIYELKKQQGGVVEAYVDVAIYYRDNGRKPQCFG